MIRYMLRSKIHRATVTETDLNYEGSLTLCKNLISAADLLVGEKVQVVNVSNGARFETYVMEGLPGSGTVRLNGAAARLGEPGDKVIIMTFAGYSEAELKKYKPIKVMVDDKNRIKNKPGKKGRK